MIKRIIIASIFCMALTGCAVTLVGTGSTGAYSMVHGDAEGFPHAKYALIWKQAKQVLSDRGTLLSEDKAGGELKARVDDAEVIVKLQRLNDFSTKMKVSALVSIIHDEDLAERIYIDITRHLQ